MRRTSRRGAAWSSKRHSTNKDWRRVSSLVYVYAIQRRPLGLEVNGIDLQPIRWITSGELAAAVSDVPREDFDEGPLNANVKDMNWLGPRAIAHQDVNERLFEASEAIVPLSFGTVFRDAAGVRRLLIDQRGALDAQLQRVAGAAEWVVALHQLREPSSEDVAAASEQVQHFRAQIEASPPGRAHLLRRQLATLERDEARRIRHEAADQLLRTLKVVAREVFQEALPSEVAAVERPLLRASVLVNRDEEQTFVDQVDRLGQRWPETTYRITLTGPWPPYRFGGLQAQP